MNSNNQLCWDRGTSTKYACDRAAVTCENRAALFVQMGRPVSLEDLPLWRCLANTMDLQAVTGHEPAARRCKQYLSAVEQVAWRLPHLVTFRVQYGNTHTTHPPSAPGTCITQHLQPAKSVPAGTARYGRSGRPYLRMNEPALRVHAGARAGAGRSVGRSAGTHSIGPGATGGYSSRAGLSKIAASVRSEGSRCLVICAVTGREVVWYALHT